MSSASSATTPRSWVMRTTAEPNSFCRSRIRSRICAWTVTSRAVVGSSAMSSSGLLTSAIAVDALAGLGDAGPVEHLDRPLARGLLVDVVVDPVRLHDLVADRVVRVHRG